MLDLFEVKNQVKRYISEKSFRGTDEILEQVGYCSHISIEQIEHDLLTDHEHYFQEKWPVATFSLPMVSLVLLATRMSFILFNADNNFIGTF